MFQRTSVHMSSHFHVHRSLFFAFCAGQISLQAGWTGYLRAAMVRCELHEQETIASVKYRSERRVCRAPRIAKARHRSIVGMEVR